MNKKKMLTIPLTAVIALIIGCVSQKAAEVGLSNSKRIIDIMVRENSESLTITIKGSQPLTYTVNKQGIPKGLLFHFPDTALDIGKGNYSPPYNHIIRSIKTGEIIKDKSVTSRIFITLKKDTPYELTPDVEGILITFSKATAISNDVKPQPKSAAKNQNPKLTQANVPIATRLKAVTAKAFKDNMVVNVDADGTVKDYKSFTLDNPAKIVFDLYNIKSPFKEEQKIAVASKWVQKIRYFGHPDRVRLVLETHVDYLSKYSALPTDSGLLIHVGDISGLSAKAGQITKNSDLGTKQVKLTWDKVPNATSYNVYLSKSPGVTKQNGFKITNINNPYWVTGLERGTTYYFIVTAVNELGESNESEEISFTVAN